MITTMKYLIILFVISIKAVNSQLPNLTKNDSLIDKLKQRVISEIPPTSIIHQFKNDSLYWMKWLEAHHLNLNSTSNYFLQHLKWRRSEKMETIHLEDWSYFQAEYPSYLDTFDKKGRPITEIWFSDWNVRKAILVGKQRQLIRWMIYLSEMGMRTLFEGRSEGKTITGGIQLIDYYGFNMITQGCPLCLQMYNFMEVLGPKQYPGIMEEIYILNMAPRFKFLFKVWKDNLRTRKAKEAIKIYENEGVWKPVIIAKVDKDQLGLRFGGTKERLNY